MVAVLVWSIFSLGTASGQLHDALDTHPTRWQLVDSDCEARVIDQGHLASEGVGAGACETVTLIAGHGTKAVLLYPIEPVLPIDDLRANLSVFSSQPGARIGLRVRFPYLRDPATRQAISVSIYGASYQKPGEFASIGIGMIEKQLRLKRVALRNQYGSKVDLSDPYVDGVVVNAYTGAGTNSIRLDELRIDGMVTVNSGIVTANARSGETSSDDVRSLRPDENRTSHRYQTAFPVANITRILQHNGEPLSWVRSLGFDAVLLNDPPNAAILSEAIRSRMLIYAPPPSSPIPALESLLEPVAGWYLGAGQAMDSRHVEAIQLESDRIRNWPDRWRRPVVGAPAETWRRYAPLLDAVIDDLPPRVRGLQPAEEIAQAVRRRTQIGDRAESAIGINSMPPANLVNQAELIADAIGAPRPSGFRWHAMWLQAVRSLETTPSAILFRSTRSLASGSPLDNQRAMALSYVNRSIAAIAPWVAVSTPMTAPTVTGAPYHVARLTNGPTEVLVLTSAAMRGSEVLCGDGSVIDIHLTPADAVKTVWRTTHFTAERMQVESTPTGPRVQIVSPDAAEVLVLSSDPEVGGQLSQSAGQFARQAALDRWQLASELVSRMESNWTAAMAAGVASGSSRSGLIRAAQRTMADAETIYRRGDAVPTLRMAKRADAWAVRSGWQLSESLMPDWPHPTSCPPIDIGASEIQVMWHGLMNNRGWGTNRLTSGGLDEASMIGPGRWSIGRRMTSRALAEVTHITRGAIDGGALQATVTPLTDEGLPGGYAGTVIQIRSPAVKILSGQAIRIEANVRTLGFGGPHQGVLVYDSIGGQEAGVLVRGHSDWETIRLYRQTTGDTDVNVMFELIGSGQATIDRVALQLWEPPAPKPAPPIRPIAANDDTESTKR